MINIIKLILLLSIITSTHAIGSLKSECTSNHHDGKYMMLEKKYIEEYAIATILYAGSYGFKVSVDNKWFKAILKEGEDKQGYRDQFSSTARIAKILNLPVNICVDNENGGYLLGIELY